MYTNQYPPLRLTFLGTGTSTGVPEVGCTCPVCLSTDPHDKRLRCSLLVESGTDRILIDCGPDFRQQMLPLPFGPLHGVLITHEHYDHVGGIDDLRPFCRFGDIPLYGEESVTEAIRQRIPYCFSPQKYPGVPEISLQDIEPFQPFRIGSTEILPIRLLHGTLPIVGYRIGRMAYLTDLLTLPAESYEALQGVDCLIMNALRTQPHVSHQSLSQALENVRRIQPAQSYFIHMSHGIGLHADVQQNLPAKVYLAYDGLQIQV